MPEDFAKKHNHNLKHTRSTIPTSKLFIIASIFVAILIAIFGLLQHHYKNTSKKVVETHKSNDKLDKEKPIQPRFDFYTLLPKQKVWVPKSALKPVVIPHKTSKNTGYILQIAAFKDKAEAKSLQKNLLNKGYATHIYQQNNWFKVWIGPYHNLAKAEKVQVAVYMSNNLKGLIVEVQQKQTQTANPDHHKP